MRLFKSWLRETRKLQQEAFRVSYDDFSYAEDAPTEKVKRLIGYISWNSKAAIHELVELDSEMAWKPWQMDAPYVHRDNAMHEAIDVLHFVANILSALDVTDEELDAAYRAKMAINRERQLGTKGYFVKRPGVKCRTCRRALDDVAPSSDDPTICAHCRRIEVLTTGVRRDA